MSFVKRAYDIARKEVFYCSEEQPLAEVAGLMHSHNIGSILVRNGKDVKGIITVNDMLRQIEKGANFAMKKARDIMSSPVVMVSRDLEIEELIDVFNSHKKLSRMVLVDSKSNVVGVVRDIAVYKYLSFYKFDEEAKKRFAEDYLHKLY